MYQEHFDLHSDPFALGPNLRFLYRSRAHAETMAHLGYGLEQGEDLILIVGVIGTGKTLALQHLQAKVSRLFRQVLVNVTNVGYAEFLKLVLHELGQTWPPKADRADLLCSLKEKALALHAEGQKILLVVDEAQNLDAATLEGVRLLANLGQPDKQLFQIVLVGQPSLVALIGSPQLAQLRQRIRIHYRLEPLTSKETDEYIAHRLSVAGRRDPIFTPAAVARIHEMSGGIPRLVNHLAGNALLSAYVAKAKRVDARHVAAEGMPEPPPPVDEPARHERASAQPAEREGVGTVQQDLANRTDDVESVGHVSTPMQDPDTLARSRLTPGCLSEPADPTRRTHRRAWVWVLLIPLALVAYAIIYLLKEDPSGGQPRVQIENLVSTTGETDVVLSETPGERPTEPADGSLTVVLDGESPTRGTVSPEPPVLSTVASDTPLAAPAERVPARRTPTEQTPAERASAGRAPTEHVSASSPLATGYWLHVASFQDKDRAMRYRSQLAVAGSPVVIREVSLERQGSRELWFRLMVGPFESLASADSAAAFLLERRLITFHRVMVY